MASAIGILVAERIAAALVVDHQISGKRQLFPEDQEISDALQGLPAEVIVERIVQQVKPLLSGQAPDAIGIGFPGIVRNGSIEDSPNLVQLKGQAMQSLLTSALGSSIRPASVAIFNDADIVAAAWQPRGATSTGSYVCGH